MPSSKYTLLYIVTGVLLTAVLTACEWNTVYKCFAKWQEQGIFEQVFHELRLAADLQDISMDSTSCKAHQHSAGAKKGGRIRP